MTKEVSLTAVKFYIERKTGVPHTILESKDKWLRIILPIRLGVDSFTEDAIENGFIIYDQDNRDVTEHVKVFCLNTETSFKGTYAVNAIKEGYLQIKGFPPLTDDDIQDMLDIQATLR